MTVQHFTLSESLPYVHSTYLGTLNTGAGLMEHPGHFTVSNSNLPLRFQLFHGRFDPEQDMDDWGFEGPTFIGQTIAHDPDRILIQDAEPTSLQLARRLGLDVVGDTITLLYLDDLVLVPKFKGDSPAYFGDHSAVST